MDNRRQPRRRMRSAAPRGLSGCRAAALLTLVSVPVLTSGCMQRADTMAELRAVRRRAYGDWKRSREQESARDRVHLSGDLELQDAIKLALVHNKDLQATLRERTIADGRVTESYEGFLPSAALQASYVRLEETPEIDIGITTLDVESLNNYSTALEVRQPVFRGGASVARQRAAQLSRLLADESVRGKVQETIFNVSSQYYQVLLARYLHQANADAVFSAERHLQDVQKKAEQGVAGDYDVLRAKVDLSNFQAEKLAQENRIELARARLLKAMGTSPDSSVVLTDDLSYDPLKPAFEQAVKVAYRNRPDLYSAELAVRVQEQHLAAAKGAYWPRVDAVLREEYSRPEPGLGGDLDSWGDRWYAGVEIAYALFEGLGREGRIQQSEATLQQAHKRLLEAEEQVVLDVRESLLNLMNAEEFVESQKLNLRRAKEATRLVEVGYREGVSTLVEVTDARSALTRARSLYYEAIHAHTIARLNLKRALGILGPEAGDRSVKDYEPSDPADVTPLAAPAPERAPDK